MLIFYSLEVFGFFLDLIVFDLSFFLNIKTVYQKQEIQIFVFYFPLPLCSSYSLLTSDNEEHSLGARSSLNLTTLGNLNA